MATNEQNVGTSHNLLNYSGMLFNQGNTMTPFSSMIGGKSRTTQSWEFTTSLSYTTGGGTTQPAITETQSLTAPTPSFVTRTQNTNFCQIFHEALALSYGKQSSMGMLSGLNIAGQEANPADELDFQVANKMAKIANDIEYVFLNGVAQKGTHDDVAYKTGGLSSVITTNTLAAAGAGLGYWLVAQLMEKIAKSNGDPNDMVLMCDGTGLMQLNADIKAQGMTTLPADRTIGGIAVQTLVTPLGTVNYVLNPKVKSGEALLVNVGICSPVEMPVPGKGNFFLEKLAKKGAADDYQIYGQLGLDYGAEWYHGKITGLSTTFTAPDYSMKVYAVNGTTGTTGGNA